MQNFPPSSAPAPHPARGGGSCRSRHGVSSGTAPWPERHHIKALQNSARRAPGFKGKEVRGERDHTQDVTLWFLAKTALPSPPRARDRPGGHKGCLLVLLHVQQDPIHPVYFGKSNDSDALSQQEGSARGTRVPELRAGCRQPSARQSSVPALRSSPCTIPVLVPRTAQRLGERARVNQAGLDSCRIFPPFCHLLKEIKILWHL